MKKTSILTIMILILLVITINVNARQIKDSPDDLLRFELINYNPSPVQPGSSFDVTFKLKNIGSLDATKLIIDSSAKYPFTIIKAETQSYEILKPGEEKTFTHTFQVNKNAIESTESLTLVYSYKNYDRTVSSTFDITVASPNKIVAVDQVRTEPEEIIPGEISSLIIGIKNSASFTMSDVAVKLNTSSPLTIVHSTNEKRIKKIQPDETVEISFDIIVKADAESKPYSYPLDISYYDESGTKFTRKDYVGIIVNYAPDYELTIDSSEIIKRGQTGKLSIKISNKATSTLKFVTTELLPTKDYSIVSEPVLYIGNIDSDDYETADYTVHANSCIFCSNTLPLKLKLEYKDSYNKKSTAIEDVDLKLYSSSEIKKYGLIPKTNISQIILIILSLIFIYLSIKEWRIERNIPIAMKKSLITMLTYLIKFLRALRWRNLKRLPHKIRIFLIRTR